MTDPDPLWHPRGLAMFDVGQISQYDNMEIAPRVGKLMGVHLLAAAGKCADGQCQVPAPSLS